MFFTVSALIIMTAAAIRDIIKRDIAVWMLVSAAAISAAAIITSALRGGSPYIAAALSLIPGACLIALSFISRESIGYGDGLFCLALGPVFGLEHLFLGLCMAFFLSAALSVMLLVSKKAGRKSRLPFLPFLAVGMGVIRFAFS